MDGLIAIGKGRAATDTPLLSLVIPTYDEIGNIGRLLDEVREVFDRSNIAGEIIVVDDGSPDGTGDFVERVGADDPRVRVVKRPGKLGLTSAVVAGFAVARGAVFGVMDADLSHPPSMLPEMLSGIRAGADFVIGSRYVEGGRIDGWPFSRRIVSKVACLLAWPFTDVRDPMSGYFLISRNCLTDVELTSKGFKIVLDLLMKARYGRVTEVPIRFVDRSVGESKISRREVFTLLRSLLGYAGESMPRFGSRHRELSTGTRDGGGRGLT